jgi:HPt (histidine-containing phosphotransfer) domain-containing protein
MKETLDLTFIRQMMGNDERLVDKFITLFKTQCPLQLEELKRYLNNKDWANLANVAHGLATQFNYFSQENLAAQVKEIENIAEEGDQNKLPDLIAAFEHGAKKFMTVLG